ncbi:MAG: phosphoglycolate phosphatase [Rhodospirillales bacterium]|nr:phosphoglycolate phosphatase [Rhodospirillales bacterium]
MPPARRFVLFDLDGTLVDTLPDLAAGVNRLMAGLGLAPFARAEVAAMIGDGVAALVRRALAARGLPMDAAALARFSDDYAAHVAVESRAFPGIAAMLDGLAAGGWRMAVCTNKPEAMARRLLDALGLARYFAAIGGGDSFPVRKPDPAHLRATLIAAGASADQAVMVGDHANDIEAAIAAGLPAIFAGWGYGPRSMASGAAALADDVAALPAILERLAPS